MILVRAMKEAKPNNEILRNEVIARMWDDTTARIDKLGVSDNLYGKQFLTFVCFSLDDQSFSKESSSAKLLR